MALSIHTETSAIKQHKTQTQLQLTLAAVFLCETVIYVRHTNHLHAVPFAEHESKPEAMLHVLFFHVKHMKGAITLVFSLVCVRCHYSCIDSMNREPRLVVANSNTAFLILLYKKDGVFTYRILSQGWGEGTGGGGTLIGLFVVWLCKQTSWSYYDLDNV